MAAALEDARAELHKRCDTIEECYEYMLAYAAQGSPTEGGQIRSFLTRADEAITALVGFTAKAGHDLQAALPAYAAFLDVTAADARASKAAVGLALAQPAITSQLVDNLNASIHLRALLTDLFLLDEALKNKGGQAG
jgi:hypothetical protein